MNFHFGTFAANQRLGVAFSASHQYRQSQGYRFAQAVVEIVAEVSPIGFAVSEKIFQTAEKDQGRDATRLSLRTVKLIETRSRSLQSWPRNAKRGIHCCQMVTKQPRKL